MKLEGALGEYIPPPTKKKCPISHRESLFTIIWYM